METTKPPRTHGDGNEDARRSDGAGPRGARAAAPLASFVTLLLSAAAGEARAQSKGGGSSAGARREERAKESWYFSDYLAGKGESSRLDALYRFYRAENRKPRPRLEPYAYGLGFTQHAREWDSWGDPLASKAGHEGAGFGGEIWANDFVSGTLGIPTLAVVPGVRGERREDTRNPWNRSTTAWGPSIRVFGANQQDSALMITYRNTRRSVLGGAYDAWAWQGGGRIYLLPFLAAEGEAVIDEGTLRGKPSRLAARSGFSYGGYLEVSLVRAGFRFERDEFRLREGGARLREERRQVFLGVSY